MRNKGHASGSRPGQLNHPESAQASDEPAGKVCPLCSGTGAPIAEREGVLLRECRCTGRTLLAWAWPSESAYAAFYSGGVEGYHRGEQVRTGYPLPLSRDTEYLVAAAARLQGIRERVSHGTLLDVGCGAGAFVAAARAAGYDAAGVDPCEELVQAGQQLGRDLRCATWCEVADYWSVITLHDVLEHLTRPLQALGHLRSCLMPADTVGHDSRVGLLVVELPEWGCEEAEREGIGWRHVKVRQHLFLPDEQAARELYTRAGFRVEGTARPCRGAIGKIVFYLSADSSGGPVPSSIASRQSANGCDDRLRQVVSIVSPSPQ